MVNFKRIKESIQQYLPFNKKTNISEPLGGKPMKKVKLTVKGRVQGVGFRYMTKMVADQLGVFGIVRNESDGSVYIEANGEPEKIDAFIEEIRKSPSPSGKVEHIDLTEDATLPTKDNFSVSN